MHVHEPCSTTKPKKKTNSGRTSIFETPGKCRWRHICFFNFVCVCYSSFLWSSVFRTKFYASELSEWARVWLSAYRIDVLWQVFGHCQVGRALRKYTWNISLFGICAFLHTHAHTLTDTDIRMLRTSTKHTDCYSFFCVVVCRVVCCVCPHSCRFVSSWAVFDCVFRSRQYFRMHLLLLYYVCR